MSSEETKAHGARGPEEDVWTAIAAFEQILEAMPRDRAALETLSHAYEQIGDHTRAIDYLVRLADVLVGDGDQHGADATLVKLQPYVQEDARAAECAGRLQQLAAGRLPEDGQVAAGPGAGVPAAGAAPEATFDIADELSLAWNLMEAGELSQDDYASVVQDLTEMSGSDSGATISVLHVLEARGFKNLERIMGFLARECGTPILGLSSFEFNYDVVATLPLPFMVRRGAVVFEFLGKDALCAVLNPYNRQLRADVEQAARRACHFFVTLPSEFDRFVQRFGDAMEERARGA